MEINHIQNNNSKSLILNLKKYGIQGDYKFNITADLIIDWLRSDSKNSPAKYGMMVEKEWQ